MAEFSGDAPGLAETARIAAEGIEGWLRAYDGYLGLVMLTDEETKTSRVITFWESREAESKSRPARKTMREQIAGTAGLDVVDYRVWDVPVFELAGADAPA